MDLDELKAALDQVAWREQVEDEVAERDPASWDDTEIVAALRRLAEEVGPALLDELERSPGYMVWALRLSPWVPGAHSRARALRHLDSADGEIRYWALWLLDSIGA
jgi:hypothetical protein